MALLSTTSFKSVELTTTCQYCQGKLYKHGKSGEGKQRFRCRICWKTQLEAYSYNAYDPQLDQNIIALTKEGVGIRGTARLLGISPTTLISRIKKIASEIKEPVLAKGKTYEVDELRTFVKKKESWSGWSVPIVVNPKELSA